MSVRRESGGTGYAAAGAGAPAPAGIRRPAGAPPREAAAAYLEATAPPTPAAAATLRPAESRPSSLVARLPLVAHLRRIAPGNGDANGTPPNIAA